MRLSQQMGLHAGIVRMNPELPITKQPQDRGRTQIPTGPAERGIAIHIPGIKSGAGLPQELDHRFAAEGGGPVERRFRFGPAVPHEAAGFRARQAHRMGIRSSVQQHPGHLVMGLAARLAQDRVQRGFPGIRQRQIHRSTVFDQELTELPVPMKRRAIQVELPSKTVE